MDHPLRQTFRTPEGPSIMLPSGGWVMAPCTTRLMPSSAKIGMRSMAFSSQGMMRSKSGSKSSFSASQGVSSSHTVAALAFS